MMQQIALIADIHGNIPALEAVFQDIDARGIRRVFCLGDIIGKGPNSDVALDMVRARCEMTVRGNWEDAILESWVSSAGFYQEQLGQERLAWVRSLPYGIFLRLSGRSVKLFHGRLTFKEVLYPDSPRERLLEALNALEEESDVAGFADTHLPFSRMVAGRLLFNIGAVGNPCDRLPQASYGILRGWEGEEVATKPLSVELVRVPYDHQAAIADARALENMPGREMYEQEVLTAIYQRGLKEADG